MGVEVRRLGKGGCEWVIVRYQLHSLHIILAYLYLGAPIPTGYASLSPGWLLESWQALDNWCVIAYFLLNAALIHANYLRYCTLRLLLCCEITTYAESYVQKSIAFGIPRIIDYSPTGVSILSSSAKGSSI